MGDTMFKYIGVQRPRYILYSMLFSGFWHGVNDDCTQR